MNRGLLPLLAGTLALSACVVPPGGFPQPPLPPLPPLPPIPGVEPQPLGAYPQVPVPPPLPQPPTAIVPGYEVGSTSVRNEYRSGYDLGTRDASYGYPSDSRRAFERFGRDYEAYFREGYDDGYNRRQLRY